MNPAIAFLDLGERARRSAVKRRVSRIRLAFAMVVAIFFFNLASLIIPSWIQVNGQVDSNLAGYQWNQLGIKAQLGVSGVCLDNSCMTLKTYCENLVSQPNSTVSGDFVNKVYARVMTGAAMSASNLLMNLIVMFFLWSSVKVMQPLSMADPSLVRIKVGATLLFIGALQILFGKYLILPALSHPSFLPTVDGVRSWGISTYLMFTAAILNMVCGAFLLYVAYAAVSDARKILHSARATVVKGADRMGSFDYKRISMDFKRMDFSVPPTVPTQTHQVKDRDVQGQVTRL